MKSSVFWGILHSFKILPSGVQEHFSSTKGLLSLHDGPRDPIFSYPIRVVIGRAFDRIPAPKREWPSKCEAPPARGAIDD